MTNHADASAYLDVWDFSKEAPSFREKLWCQLLDAACTPRNGDASGPEGAPPALSKDVGEQERDYVPPGP